MALALTAAAPPAFPAGPATRGEALQALASPDAESRAAAVAWLAAHGAMADARLLDERLRDENALVRDRAQHALWRLWARSGDPLIDSYLARGTEAMEAGRLAEAIGIFSEVIERDPGFAEGWNRRATAWYLAGEYRKSIADCDEVLKRNPRHFGALTGLGRIHTDLEDYAAALAWFRRALEVNPNMRGVELTIREIEALLEEAKRRRST